MRSWMVLSVCFLLTGCRAARTPATDPTPPRVFPKAGPQSFALPGATAPASLDYVAYEERTARVWIPVPTTGTVDLFDVKTSAFTRIEGLPIAERELRGKKRTFGPTSVTFGEHHAYIGSRAGNEICPVDLASLEVKPCFALPGSIDGIDYVASVKEIWVTTGEASIAIIDASAATALKTKTVLELEGTPEGYAQDASRGIFVTNLEDKDATLAIDVKTHKVMSTWKPGCGKDGPRGIRVDPELGFAIVACTDHIQILDIAHGGAPLGKLDAGAGIDNIDYAPRDRLVYVAAGKAARLTVARVDDHGQLTLTSSTATVPGTRTVVTDASGNAYVPDAHGARLLVYPRVTP